MTRWSEADVAAVVARQGKGTGVHRRGDRDAAKGEGAANTTRGSQRRQKYRAQPTMVNGVRFDSRREATVWRQLLVSQVVGWISQLQRQVVYPLVVDGVKVGRITWDFAWVDNKTGEFVIADCKSPPTRKETAYRLRKRLFEACYPMLTVTEVE